MLEPLLEPFSKKASTPKTFQVSKGSAQPLYQH